MPRLFFTLLLLVTLTCSRAEEKLVSVEEGASLGDYTLEFQPTNRKDGTADFTVTISPRSGSLPSDSRPHARLGFLTWEHGAKITDTRQLTPRLQDRSLVYTFAVNPGWLLDSTPQFVFTVFPAAAYPEGTSYHFPLLSYTEDGPNPRESYAALRTYQKTPSYLSMGIASEDYRVDLNGDGHRERMVNFGWRAHQDNRSIFTLRHQKWHFIGYIDLGESLKVLRKTRRGWHDFYVDRELARSEVVREFYRWDTRSKLYEMHSSRQIRPAERVPE